MGMFDRVMAECPNCGEAIEFQSKSGPCSLADYSVNDAPDEVMEGVVGDVETCPKCQSEWRILPVGNKVQYGLVDPSEHTSICSGRHCSRCGSCDGGTCICYAR